MTVKVMFFANLRDYAETDSLNIEIESSGVVRDLLAAMKGIVPNRLIEVLEDESAMVSVNQKYAGWDGVVNDGDEVGILPPVSGG